MRLIDADALRAQFPEPEDWGNPYKALVHITGIWAEIDNVPTIEMPEIIHCRDCKHSEHWYRDRRRCFLWPEDGVYVVFNDGFCNYAERRQDESEKL